MVAFTAQKMGYVGTCLMGYVGTFQATDTAPRPDGTIFQTLSHCGGPARGNRAKKQQKRAKSLGPGDALRAFFQTTDTAPSPNGTVFYALSHCGGPAPEKRAKTAKADLSALLGGSGHVRTLSGPSEDLIRSL